MNFSSLRSINRTVEDKRMNVYIAEVESNPSSGRHLCLFLVSRQMFPRPILGWELLQKLPVTISHVRNHKLGWQRPVNSKYQPTDNSPVAVLELQNGTNCSERPKGCFLSSQRLLTINWFRWSLSPSGYLRQIWRFGHLITRMGPRDRHPQLSLTQRHKNVSTTVIRPGWQTTRTPEYYNWKAPQNTCQRS